MFTVLEVLVVYSYLCDRQLLSQWLTQMEHHSSIAQSVTIINGHKITDPMVPGYTIKNMT